MDTHAPSPPRPGSPSAAPGAPDPPPTTDTLSADTLVADALARWPAAASVFLHRRMACPGCAMAPLMTLGEAAASYGVDAARLLEDIARAAAGTAPAGPFEPPLPHA